MAAHRRSRCDPQLLHRARQMRHEPAPAEKKLWSCLRNHRLDGFQFRRQHPVGGYVTDFYCAAAKLVVELDGDSHDGREEYDEQRTRILQHEGCLVIRFLNADVFDHLDAVLEAILGACEARVGRGPPHPCPPP